MTHVISLSEVRRTSEAFSVLFDGRIVLQSTSRGKKHGFGRLIDKTRAVDLGESFITVNQ